MSELSGADLIAWARKTIEKKPVGALYTGRVEMAEDIIKAYEFGRGASAAGPESHGATLKMNQDSSTLLGGERGEETGSSQMSAEPSAADRSIMGTAADAEVALIERAATWRQFRQPLIAAAKEHKQRQIMERESLFRLGNAALLWLWHVENPEPKVVAPDLLTEGGIDGPL